ncbi:hypothetical protein [Bordetella genomosp. 11]|uniref:Lipoprotein n=1 Tax=Bordetella genomosp. 11 TaxID=1416808 RepID=A0A261UFR5_9BORD|nr:hypothetical protein [Bordetella genomosp. 11]OZI60744.1 hypothetical protein CAL28_15275 [Bordetella genomosp. 11]
MRATPVPPPRPWYREPWPWILMAGPAAVLAGCVFTIYLAATRYTDPPITEGVTREGLVVRKVPAVRAAPPRVPAPAHPDAPGK